MTRCFGPWDMSAACPVRKGFEVGIDTVLVIIYSLGPFGVEWRYESAVGGSGPIIIHTGKPIVPGREEACHLVDEHLRRDGHVCFDTTEEWERVRLLA